MRAKTKERNALKWGQRNKPGFLNGALKWTRKRKQQIVENMDMMVRQKLNKGELKNKTYKERLIQI
jgi:hypothetical protein